MDSNYRRSCQADHHHQLQSPRDPTSTSGHASVRGVSVGTGRHPPPLDSRTGSIRRSCRHIASRSARKPLTTADRLQLLGRSPGIADLQLHLPCRKRMRTSGRTNSRAHSSSKFKAHPRAAWPRVPEFSETHTSRDQALRKCEMNHIDRDVGSCRRPRCDAVRRCSGAGGKRHQGRDRTVREGRDGVSRDHGYPRQGDSEWRSWTTQNASPSFHRSSRPVSWSVEEAGAAWRVVARSRDGARRRISTWAAGASAGRLVRNRPTSSCCS